MDPSPSSSSNTSPSNTNNNNTTHNNTSTPHANTRNNDASHTQNNTTPHNTNSAPSSHTSNTDTNTSTPSDSDAPTSTITDMQEDAQFLLELHERLAVTVDDRPVTHQDITIVTIILSYEKGAHTFDELATILISGITQDWSKALADHLVIEYLINSVDEDNPHSMKLLGDFLEKYSSVCQIQPGVAPGVFHFLEDAIAGRNPLPPGPATKCMIWLCNNPLNAKLLEKKMTEKHIVEARISLLKATWDIELGQKILKSLYIVTATGPHALLELFGKTGIQVVLRMLMRNEHAIMLLKTLLTVPANRELLREINGVGILLAYTKKTQSPFGLETLVALAKEDKTIYNKIYLELSEWIIGSINFHIQEGNSNSIKRICDWIMDVTDQKALDCLVEHGLLSAVSNFPNDLDFKFRVELVAKVVGHTPHEGLNQPLDDMKGFVASLIRCIAKGDDLSNTEHSLWILAMYFAAYEFEGETHHKANFSLYITILPQLCSFISHSPALRVPSIYVLNGAINVTRIPHDAAKLVPLLPHILECGEQTMKLDGKSILLSAIIGILYAIAKLPGIDINVLLGNRVVTFLQSWYSSERFSSPHMEMLLHTLYTAYHPGSLLYRRYRDAPVLAPLLEHSNRFCKPLVEGKAIETILHTCQHFPSSSASKEVHDKVDVLLWVVSQLAYFGATNIVAHEGAISFLLDNDCSTVRQIIWLITLRKRSRRKLSTEHREAIKKFATDHDRTPILDCFEKAILYNLSSSDDGDSDGETELNSLSSFSATTASSSSAHPNSKGKKKKKKGEESSTPLSPFTHEVVVRLHAMCENASRALALSRGQTEIRDSFDNIYLLLRYMGLDSMSKIRLDSLCIFIIHTWLYGNLRQVTKAHWSFVIAARDFRDNAPNEGDLLANLIPVIKKYVQGGRAIAPLPAHDMVELERMLTEIGGDHRSSLFAETKEKEVSGEDYAKLRDEIKKLKDTVGVQKQSLLTLSKAEATATVTVKQQSAQIQQLQQATAAQMNEIRIQKDQEISNLSNQLKQLKTEHQDPSQTLDSINVDSISSMEEFDGFYSKLKHKLKEAKQKKSKLKQEKQEQDEKAKAALAALLCPICQDRRITLTCNPCGHAFCKECTDTMFPLNGKMCPICRKNVKSTITIYL